MAAFKSDFMRIVHERGMVHQCSDAARLDELLASGIRTAYIGFDCTADSLHVGSCCRSCCCAGGRRPATSRSR